MNLKLLACTIITSCSIYATSLQVRSIYDLMNENANIKFYKCHDPIPFEYKPFPLAEYSYFHPNKGCFDLTGVFVIPNGIIYDHPGDLVLANPQTIIKEFLGTHYSLYTNLNFMNLYFSKASRTIKKYRGRLAVVRALSSTVYGHWIGEILAKIELLQMTNITYDWLYLICDKPYINEIIEILNLDTSKIIQDPLSEYDIQADELIIPSLPARFIPMQNDHNYGNEHFTSLYIPQWHIKWLQETFITPAIQQENTFCDKVFISRKDTNIRKVLNEDELFSFFEQKGFKRYNLSSMSFLQQVQLFHQSKSIVCPHGSGLTNIIFCKPGTCIVEIFQNQFDATFCYLSQDLKLEYHCIKTQERQHIDLKIDTYIPINIVEQYINKHIPNL